MRNFALCLLLMGLIGASCSPTSRGIFSKRTAHEKYAEKLDDNNLEKTVEGRQWLAASKAALQSPQLITLPYRQAGNFQLDKPRALGLKFTANRGEKIMFTITKNTAADFVLFADLFRQEGTESSLLVSAEQGASDLSYEVEETGSYVLRLQPELYQAGDYQLSVSVGPSLDFPVAGAKAKAGSFWGASRDGGKRRHEGIDIFAPKGTPAVASADGVITGVQEGGLGGKVVWLRPTGKNYTLYYAHLDKQLVTEGQQVKKGTILGTVGNTGNAKHTPAHLHFGVYTSSGPIDPYPFVNKEVKNAPAVPKKSLAHYLKLTKSQKLEGSSLPLKANTLVVPIAVTAKGYLSELPDGNVALLPFTSVQPSNQLIRAGYAGMDSAYSVKKKR